MKKIILLPLLAIVWTSAFAQVLYMTTCNSNCENCDLDSINKVEYVADLNTGNVLRTFTSSSKKYNKVITDVDSISNCKIIDKDNWVCEGYGPPEKGWGKQFATKGIVYWNNGVPSKDGSKVCTFDKNLIGQLKLRN